MTQVPNDTTARDLNLLFGVLAIQNRLLTPQQLAQGAAAWAAKPGTSLADHLVQMGFLSAEGKEAIEQLLRLQLSAHAGDASGALSQFGDLAAIQSSFGPAIKITEKGVECSLESFGGDALTDLSLREGPRLGETLSDEAKITREHPGRYTIKGEHGRGGIGRVMVAFDEHIGREVALKELLPEKGATGSPSGISPSRFSAAVVRFLREARITGWLEHPGIVPVYEIARREDGTIYYTMKLVRGQTLYERIQNAKNLQERLALLPHFADLCQAMAYAHSKGVLHRDLKPQNVMVGSFGETVVLDWGLAKLKKLKEETSEGCEPRKDIALIKASYAGETVDGSAIGTPSYMSPEQAMGNMQEIDERSDVWSLGAILYEILTGEPPFTGEIVYEVMGKVIKDPVVPIREKEPKAPPELCAIAEKCLNKDKSQRYKDAAELAEDVVRFQTGGLVSAYEYSMTALVWKWTKKYWPLITTAGVALLALMIFGTYFFFRIREERNLAIKSLAEAYYQKGRQAEQAAHWAEARLFYSKALALTGREEARMALYRGELQSVRISPAQSFSLDQGFGQAVAYSPDQKFVAVGSQAPLISLFHLEGKAPKNLTGHTGSVLALAFSPDGKTLASGSRDTTIKLWNPETGFCKKTLTGNADAVSALAFSPDSKFLLAGSQDAKLKLWPMEGNLPPREFLGHTSYISAVAFLPDGKTMLSASGDKTLKLWNVESGECLHTFLGHESEVWSLSLSPDGKTALSGDLGGKLLFWDLEKKSLVKTVQANAGPLYALTISPSGQFALSAGEGKSLSFWSLKRGERINEISAHEDTIYALAFAPDGKKLATVSADHQVKLWTLDYLEPEQRWRLGKTNFVAISPDGKTALSGEAPSLPSAGKCSAPLSCPTLLLAKDTPLKSNWLETAEESLLIETLPAEIVFWSLSQTECLLRLCGKGGYLRGAAISPDGKMAAGGGEAGSITLWSLATGDQLKTFVGHQAEVTSVVFTPDSKQLLSAADDHTVKLWSVESGQILREYRSPEWGYSLSLLLLPDGKHFVVNSDSWNALRLWSVETGAPVLSLPSDHDSFVALAFSPDGKKFLSGGCAQREASGECKQGEIKLWELPTGKPLTTFSGDTVEVTALAFSPQNNYALAGYKNGKIKLWSLTSKSSLMTFTSEENKPIKFLAFSADGSFLISLNQDHVLIRRPADWGLFTAGKGESGEKLYLQAQKESGLQLQGVEIKRLDSRPQAATPH